MNTNPLAGNGVHSRSNVLRSHTSLLRQDLLYMKAMLERRLNEVLGTTFQLDQLPADWPAVQEHDCHYARLLSKYPVDNIDRALLVLALIPDFAPHMLDFFKLREADGHTSSILGGHLGTVHKGVVPTLQTAIFLFGTQTEKTEVDLMGKFRSGSVLIKAGLLKVVRNAATDPYSSCLLLPDDNLLDLLVLGDLAVPEFGEDFPASKLVTTQKWEDLILAKATMDELDEIRKWLVHERKIMQDWGFGRKFAPGFKALFYGPPGTGKTMAATLLGQSTGRDVYRIDLSMVVSKYIGETEKNLRKVFDKAQSRGWILFFDEADALFGKRTDLTDSKDRFANQEVSYLLQRIESFDGVAILATNFKENLDKAFSRRFQSLIQFSMPSPELRLLLWQAALPKTCAWDQEVNLDEFARKHELSGAAIMNVVRYCALQAADRSSAVFGLNEAVEGIRREYRKLGRLLA